MNRKIVFILIFAVVLALTTTYFVATMPTGYVVGSVTTEHVKGQGPIEIMEFSDFQCPFCGKVQPTLERVLSEYDGKVKLAFKHYPLQFHQYARKAAEASECAADQGKFWEYHDKLFANQDKLAIDDLKRYAQELGLNTNDFNACLDSGQMSGIIAKNMQKANDLGISGTPSFFINGKKIEGAQPFDAFKKIIDEELSKTQE